MLKGVNSIGSSILLPSPLRKRNAYLIDLYIHTFIFSFDGAKKKHIIPTIGSRCTLGKSFYFKNALVFPVAPS